MTDISACRLLDHPKIADSRGNLTFIESLEQIPFSIKRVYYLYDVPAGGLRGGHAHQTLEQFIISANGSFDVVLYDGNSKKTVPLNRPFMGLYIPSMIWRELNNFLQVLSASFSLQTYIERKIISGALICSGISRGKTTYNRA